MLAACDPGVARVKVLAHHVAHTFKTRRVFLTTMSKNKTKLIGGWTGPNMGELNRNDR